MATSISRVDDLQNVPDHRGREEDVATGESVVAASGASDGSPIQARR